MKRTKYAAILIIAIGIIGAFLTTNKKENSAPLQYIGVEGEKNMIPNDWFAYQRMWPHKTMNKKAMTEGMKQAQLMPERKGEYTWELVGPTNIGGRITDIEFHEDNAEVVYVGAATGGVFKTENSGDSWTNIFIDVPNVNIGDICIDPNNEEIIYVGTGEANNASLSYYGDGLYKSVNGGETWENIGLTESSYIARVIVDYNDSQRVFAACCGDLFSPNDERGIYRSIDGGQNWEQTLFITDTTAAIELVQHPTNPDVLYAGMWERTRSLTARRSFGLSTGIWRTSDGGDNWEELTNGLPQDEAGRVGIVISPSNPDVMYAWYDMPDQDVELYRSDDGGDSWTQKPTGSIAGMNSTFGWYFGQIRIDPNDEDRIYLLGMEMWRSENGGNNWTVLSDYGNMDEIHVDHHAMKTDPATGKIWEGNDGGLYYSMNYGNNWVKVNNLPVTQPYSLDVSQQDPEIVVCGSQDNGSNLTTNGVDQWSQILGGDGMYCRIDYTDDNIMYAESQWGNLYRFNNGWYDYIAGAPSNDSPRINWSAPLEMHPVDPETLYFGTYRVWKSTNRGDSWVPVSGDLTGGDGNSSFYTVTTIGVHPANPNIVIAGTTDGKVHVSTNGGLSWNDVSEGLPGRWITKVIGDPFDENKIYATMSGLRWSDYISHVYMSENLGVDWIDISGNLPELPANTILADPDHEGSLFIGLDAGVYQTRDFGETWVGMNDGIAKAPIVDLRLQKATRQLYLGAYGTSIYKVQLNDVYTGIDDIAASTIELKAYPNPANADAPQGITIPVTLSTQGYAQAFITDLSGKKIEQIFEGTLAAGTTELVWNPSESPITLPAGIYFCTISSQGMQKTEKVVLK